MSFLQKNNLRRRTLSIFLTITMFLGAVIPISAQEIGSTDIPQVVTEHEHGNQFLQISKNRYGEVNIKKASEHNLG